MSPIKFRIKVCFISMLTLSGCASVASGPNQLSNPSDSGRASAESTVSPLLLRPGDPSLRLELEGRGSSHSDARDDIIRQALQIATQQTVIADRLIENDRVVVDRVLSTYNGFITNLQVHSTSISDDREVRISATITVDTKGIENFIDLQSSTRARVDGASAFAEVRRAQLHLDAVDTMMMRIMSNYPQGAVDTELESFELQDLSRINLTFSVKGRDAFFTALEETLDVLSVSQVHWSRLWPDQFSSYSQSASNTVCVGEARRWPPSSYAPRRSSGSWVNTTRHHPPRAICDGAACAEFLRSGRRVKCFNMPPGGDFLNQLLPDRAVRHAHQLVFLMAVLDENGQSVIKDGRQCLSAIPPDRDWLPLRANGELLHVLKPASRLSLYLDPDIVHLERAVHVVGGPVIRSGHNRYFPNFGSNPMTQARACAHMLSINPPAL